LFFFWACAKHPGYSVEELKDHLLAGHRSKPGKEKLAEAIKRTRDMLGLLMITW
jgi:phosphoserine aminotransferase